MNNPPGDSTIPLPLYEECGPLYGNNDAIMQQKAPEAASVGQNFGDYEFILCKAYGVHNKAEEMMEEVCYDEMVTPGEGHWSSLRIENCDSYIVRQYLIQLLAISYILFNALNMIM